MKNMFKIFIILIIICAIAIGGYYFYNSKNNQNNKPEEIIFEDLIASINELYIYGKHLNLSGTLDIDAEISKIELVLLDTNQVEYNLNFEQNSEYILFNASQLKNKGINLDELKHGQYIVYLKVTDINNNTKNYKLTNKTPYDETEYFTLRNEEKFNYILIKEDRYDTLNISVGSSNEKNIYDIVIDAGHGGIDSGACYKGLCETDFTLTLSKKLKEKLESYGLKVKLTRDDTIPTNVRFETYGKDGRIDRAMTSKAKYLFSFHLNSGLYTRTGTEIYTTNNIDYTLASSIVDNIVKNTNTNYSNNPIFKVANGVYTRTFQNYEINDVIKEANTEGYEPYPITTDTTYYYIIRETGGFMTGAYTDGREDDYNMHYNTNVGIESYIMEIGYITNSNDTNDISNNMDSYINAIAEAIINNIWE